MRHDLKTAPEFFAEIAAFRKTFEVRKNDRKFAVGDILLLREWHPSQGYTGREACRIVTYLTDYEQRRGFVVLAIAAFTESFRFQDLMPGTYTLETLASALGVGCETIAKGQRLARCFAAFAEKAFADKHRTKRFFVTGNSRNRKFQVA